MSISLHHLFSKNHASLAKHASCPSFRFLVLWMEYKSLDKSFSFSLLFILLPTIRAFSSSLLFILLPTIRAILGMINHITSIFFQSCQHNNYIMFHTYMKVDKSVYSVLDIYIEHFIRLPGRRRLRWDLSNISTAAE